MQAYPYNWDSVLRELFTDKLVRSSEKADKDFSGIIELNTRINFKFNREKFTAFKASQAVDGLDIRRSGLEIYHEMNGSVVPRYFWENAESFIDRGAGYSLYHKNQLACTAYSAFVMDHMLELGIETIPEFRGKGYAQQTCAALIDYCLDNGYEPVWACKLENTGSYKLAQKIGFEPSAEIPYYGLAQ
jgi:GNAT superfamily N-acetyltransferase